LGVNCGLHKVGGPARILLFNHAGAGEVKGGGYIYPLNWVKELY